MDGEVLYDFLCKCGGKCACYMVRCHGLVYVIPLPSIHEGRAVPLLLGGRLRVGRRVALRRITVARRRVPMRRVSGRRIARRRVSLRRISLGSVPRRRVGVLGVVLWRIT
ncbi:hypothetical protein B296_00041789 [Ensete ventricosum]|uniref:Uncharacterized protein n=1 Tax=Ensete ventricosum TaxID=4639 RepID=A0A426Y149_ENSVE|nr:hypothetical protein B296_00041789 [Ensete ventricosum]